ncbi:MAG TPA: Y-family DNA polymerase, partial [Pyrinomonadaceae bacterium]|nr:Y-family DNA polymerase [Pyrinomonadaceae bacterium]
MISSIITHIDCNNFYASCERLFDAKIQTSPVVVLSNNDGCVVAQSNESKKLGIKRGQPVFQIQNLIEKENVEVFSSNYSLYGDLSARVMDELQTYSPDSEIYSIDEAFLEFPAKGSEHGSQLVEKGWEIKNAIKKRVGIPVSVGFGETKTLAKIANRLAKKSVKANGVLDLYRSQYLPLALERTEIGDVWGVGGASVQKLKNIRIENALQFRNLDVRYVRKLLTVTGARTVLELRGIKCIPLEQTTANKKNIAATRTFGAKITAKRELKEAVAYFVSLTLEKLRKHELMANSISVFVGSDRFGSGDYYSNSASYSAVYASDLLSEIQSWAFTCLERIF